MKASNSLPRKGLAVIASGMVAFAALGMAPGAIAQSPPPPTDSANEVSANLVSQLGANDQATLTIHKLKGNFAGTNQWGTEQSGVAGEAMDGVVFDIYRVKDIDLSTIDGWKAYDELNGTDPNKLIDDGKVDEVGSVTTANGGVATFTGTIGVYVVKENLVASTAVRGTYAPSAPFITSLPFTTQDGTGWNKDVHVYPKNQEQTATKKVKDQDKHARDTITYTLDGTVPPIPSTHTGNYFDGYSLVDIYDPTKWTPNTSSITVSIVNGGDTTELAATDFQVSEPGEYTANQDEQGKYAFSISLTRAGLKKLEDVARTTDSAKVVASVEGALAEELVPGEVVNKAFLIPPNIATPDWDRPTDPDNPNDPPVPPTPPVEVPSKYGKLDVTKASSRDENTKLKGATFQLYKCENNNNPGGQGTLLEDSTPLTVDGASEWTTDDQGQFSITGIQLEDWFDGSAQEDSFDYCLVETKAPEGYELLPKPVLVPINQNTTSLTLTSTITNVPSTPGTFKLPATGEWGRWWLIAGGTAALIAALGVTYNATRREQNDA